MAAANGDLNNALTLYERNTKLSEAFYIPLQSMEICFRNTINDALCAKFDPEWFRPGKVQFDQDGVDTITEIVRQLNQTQIPVTTGAVVAEMNFGFWVSLLAPRYDTRLWRTCLYKIFVDPAQKLSRQTVHGRMNALRRFRNRVAHHEPIFHKDILGVHDEILGATAWMCPDTAAWAAHHSRVPTVFHGK